MRTLLPALALLVPLAASPSPPPPPLSPLGPDAATAEALTARAVATVAAREPPVESLQRAAARVAERASEDLTDYPARARWAALLPHFTAEFRRDQAANRVVGLQGSGEVDYLRLAPSNTFLVRATWDLPSLVAAPGELQAETQLAARARRRADAVEKVTKLFFERRKLRVALLVAPPGDPVARAQAEVDIARLGAEIDALTGGRLGEGAP
jgi:hypothetical protein